MKKIKCYVETSVLNFVIAKDDLERQKVTKELFDSWCNGEQQVFISDVVIEEISRAPEEIKLKLTDLIKKLNPVILSIDEEVEELSNKYISEGIIPVKYRNDSRHIAIAVVNDLDVIVSWNMQHIVKLKTKIQTEGINRLFGYKTIEIMTPEEVL